MGLTSIFLKDSSQCEIKNIQIGMILEDGSRVIAKQKIKNTEQLYIYNNRIYVSGEHKVLENNIITLIKNSSLSISTSCCPPFVYCLTTNTGVINIRGDIFIDFSESRNFFINQTVNELILDFWNSGKKNLSKFSKGVVFLENGFAHDTKFTLANNKIKNIEHVMVGDVLENNNLVLGKIELDPYYFLFFEFCGVVVSINTKVYDDIFWKNVECVEHSEPTKKPLKAFNLITDKGIMKSKNNYFIDYFQLKNKSLSDEVSSLLDIGFATSYKNHNILNIKYINNI